MKNVLITAGVCLASFLTTTLANAAPIQLAKVTLPHAVRFGVVEVPAGECTISRLSDNGRSSTLLIRSANVSVEAVVSNIADPSTNSEPRLTMRYNGGTYQFDKVLMPGVEHGYQF